MPTTPLWAPWRMPYIEASQARDEDRGCFFCEHAEDAARLRENLVLVVQTHAIALLNRYPFAPCHVLVAPRRHVPDLSDLSDDEYHAVMALLRDTTVRLRRAVSCPAMNVGFNLGLHAGAGHAEHCHGHVVPRWPGDTSFMPVLADVRVMPEALDQTWQKLHAAFGDVPGLKA
ncbi:MAG: HIT domain-containing protein [Labilithrix sp.]|nr:HIT domain-containing protein [Labilithrix sp.]MCW5813995.1 HIT domain-containing protein [Labilithrix sp.]